MYPMNKDTDPLRHVGRGDVHEDERPGLTCDDCEAWSEARRNRMADNFEDNWSGLMFTSVPGGASVARMGGGKGRGVTPIEHRKEFEKGMNDYRENKKAGLTPESTNVGGVEKAYKKAERNERIKKKYDSGELDARGINLEPAFRQAVGME